MAEGLRSLLDAKTASQTLQGLGSEPSMTFGVVMKIFGKFAYLFVVSLLMGVAFGLVVALLLKKYNVSTYPQVIIGPPSSIRIPALLLRNN